MSGRFLPRWNQLEGDYITFDHVSVGYLPDQPILKDYSFKVAKGEHVTFVSRTGKGKSTILKLLLGLYHPQKGKILLDGHSPDDHPKNQRHFLAICEQGVALVDGTVKDQITLYDDTITAEMIDKTLAMVGLTDIVKNLPQGLNTPVSEINLSQGQLQLLMIARSVVCDPQILLLDEMTASLDRETEAKVLKAIDAASSGRTVLSISHRRGAHDGRIIKL